MGTEKFTMRGFTESTGSGGNVSHWMSKNSSSSSNQITEQPTTNAGSSFVMGGSPLQKAQPSFADRMALQDMERETIGERSMKPRNTDKNDKSTVQATAVAVLLLVLAVVAFFIKTGPKERPISKKQLNEELKVSDSPDSISAYRFRPSWDPN